MRNPTEDGSLPVGRRHFPGNLAAASGALVAFATPTTSSAQTEKTGASFNVRAYGAAGDGKKLDTPSLQAAIDECAAAAGGTGRIPAGTYLSGTLFLKSNVTLWLEAGTVLAGSTDLKDYPPRTPAFRSYTDVNYVEHSLLYAEKVERVSIVGPGVIDGQGEAKTWQLGHGRASYKRGLTPDGIELATVAPDQRPALLCDEVEGLELTGWRAAGTPAGPEILLRNVCDAWIHGCRHAPMSAAFVRVEGDGSRDLCIAALARRKEQSLLDRSPEVAAEIVRLIPQ